MKKIVKRWGGSYIIRLTPEEMKAYGLKEGDTLEVEIKKENSD